MKTLSFTLFFIFSITNVFAQKSIESTNQFTIWGLVDKPKTVNFSDLQKEKSIEIGDFKITNHAGEFRKEYKKLKVVPLLNLFKDVNFTAESPKV